MEKKKALAVIKDDAATGPGDAGWQWALAEKPSKLAPDGKVSHETKIIMIQKYCECGHIK